MDYSNRYTATRLPNGYRITCTHYRGSASHQTIRNETKGTSVAGTGSLDFDFGDEGEIFDGDEDWDDIYVLQNVDVETGTRKLTVVESIEKRLQGIEEVKNLEALPINASLTDVVTRLNVILAALKG